jgi:hypothetical protein
MLCPASLPHATSGQTFFYPAFGGTQAEDTDKFAHELGAVLCMPLLLEANARVRVSKGICSLVLDTNIAKHLEQGYASPRSMGAFLCARRTYS